MVKKMVQLNPSMKMVRNGGREITKTARELASALVGMKMVRYIQSQIGKTMNASVGTVLNNEFTLI
jgi:hypothetical protein